MLTAKRVIIASVCGLIFGGVCATMAATNPDATEVLPMTMLLTIVFGRGLTGFTIGISALKMNWWLHGILIGFIGSIPMALPIFHRLDIFIGTFVMGIIYGFLTELITTKLFKAPAAAYANVT